MLYFYILYIIYCSHPPLFIGVHFCNRTKFWQVYLKYIGSRLTTIENKRLTELFAFAKPRALSLYFLHNVPTRSTSRYLPWRRQSVRPGHT